MKPDTGLRTEQTSAVLHQTRSWPTLALSLVAAMVALTAPEPSLAQIISFGPGTEYPTGNGSQAVATWDINRDGKTDLVVADSEDNTVSLLFGNGDGSFSPRTFCPVGDAPVAVAIADFNGDGTPDVAVANGANHTVSVLLLNTGGTLCGTRTDYPVGEGPYAVARGDLNLDGKVDLVTANFFGNPVSVLLGDGTGSFGPRTDHPVGNGAEHVAIGDLNGDGRPDLVVANFYDNTVSILFGDGSPGIFSPPIQIAVGAGPTFVAIGDLNLDGKLDVVVAHAYTSYLSVFRGDGTGLVFPAVDVAVLGGAQSVEIADFNNDGKPDLAVAYTLANLVSILPGNGAWSFGPAMNCIAGSGPSYADLLATGEFNQDGKLDLAVVNTSDDTVSVLLNTDDPAATTAPDLVVSSLTANISGSGVVINDTQQNIGPQPAGAFTVAFYFATTPDLPANGTLIGSRSLSGLAANGATNNASTWFAIPPGTPTGSFLVCAITDFGGTVNELDKTNNVRCTTQSYTIGPDLVVHALSALRSGGILYVTDTQRNLGNRQAEPSTVSFYLSSNTVFDAGDRPLGSRSVPSLAGGGAMDKKTTALPIPAGLAVGNYYVLAISDSWNVVIELNEGNNAKATTGTYRLP